MNLDLELVRTFLAVIEQGGFTRAAGRLHKTQSTISLHIRRLEEIVGRPLFDRQGRGVALTEQGEVLRTYAEALLELNDEALLKLRRPPVTGTVRLGLPEDFATRHLPLVLRRFTAAHPAIRLEVRSALTAELMRDLGNGDLDIVLARREFEATDGDALWREPLVWVGARGRAFAADPLPLVMFPHGCVYRPEVLRRMRACARPWEIVYTSTSLAGVQAAVSAGIGITALAESTVLPEFEILGAADGLPALPDTEIALYAGATRSEAARYLGTYLSDSVQNLAPPARGDSLRDAPVRIAR
ncbi:MULTISPECIES: LysR substrate-binding domain-containing protein [Bradyrhizobium]|jgi:DNA-binding transcriptional LysR family regulator|uniref:DNA-binding transcriptional LysR family regulator n=1 Tax=Bradyrhizobium elkanii TaxID=29448 RepID=A0A7Y8QXM9_BRAEL|nr:MULTISPECIES: LysR substrate-binding domain-containing protein [Bradyrhizobium]MBP1298902.1 DNA-binding transcriptional LysR family regulator [Bradyrhizobium elkanii]MCP1756521.1 DNA-binding transcriptional LysR family regulator [Bradyrhizobium elkanii]MCP1930239.1 DNA-binding transcriptional LysR family regulator [Bradyrhizobium elkanii]MCP1982034.1 DNA-binding transcriptional LysR family regulator [Bradyrhizobium elkanii]MCS3481503.1 DNA-binding transcriptional LysR family regulator [Brad